jgi:hypothetical protein
MEMLALCHLHSPSLFAQAVLKMLIDASFRQAAVSAFYA